MRNFVLNGCEPHALEDRLEGSDGAHPIRLLYSLATNDLVSLLSYENDDMIPPSEIENFGTSPGIHAAGV